MCRVGRDRNGSIEVWINLFELHLAPKKAATASSALDLEEELNQVQKPGHNMAEEVGFEPTRSCPLTVFKTVAFDHSATPPSPRF